MELKAYQRDVLKEIGRYARTYAMLGDAATAYGVFLGAAGLTPGKDGVAPYHDDLSGVPRVCAKVPTGGGKTLIGAAAVGCIFDALPAHDEVVVWLVPRREILSQTLRNLRDPDHFLRQTLDRDFAGRVEVLSKEDGLAGRGFNANTMGDGLTVFVLSYDSFKNKEGRRAYAENSALAGLTELQRAGGTAFDVDGADDTALISALAGSNPLVVVDESHHAGSRLSVDMLRNLNPRFVLELTATPDARRTNVIAQATARQLKREEMVKLPVVVYRRPDKRTVVQDAVMLQRRLEAVAESDERRTGRYIRPIVLFQAERRDSAGAETYELLRDRLVEAGIPAEQVAVRTGDVDEIGGANLMSRDCPIRFIITVEALAEGWDCPFAYVLATVANKSSKVSAEQIVGRVLRQPHACRASSRSLNIAYVLTSSADFDGTVQQVVDGLNGSGFSQRDVVEERGDEPPAPAEPLFGAGGGADPEGAGEEAIGALDLSGATEGGRPPQGDEVDEIMARGGELEESYEGLDCNIGTVGGVYCSLGGDAGVHGMRESVADAARALRIPKFLARIDGGLFTLDEEYVPLERENLLGDFKLSKLGIDRVHIDVTAFSDARAVDLVEDSDAYKIRRLDEDVRNNMRMLFSTLSDEGKRDSLVALVLSATTSQFRRTFGEEQMRSYIRRIVDDMDQATVEACFDSVGSVARCVQDAVRELASEHCESRFEMMLTNGSIVCDPSYKLPDSFRLARPNTSYAQTLYEAEEGDLDGIELKMADLLSNSGRIRWWHRVAERREGEFCINGFINHYPDFLAQTTDGVVLAIETKGGHLIGEDSEAKLRLGTRWADMAGREFRYVMVFESQKLDMANSLTLAEFSSGVLGC